MCHASFLIFEFHRVPSYWFQVNRRLKLLANQVIAAQIHHAEFASQAELNSDKTGAVANRKCARSLQCRALLQRARWPTFTLSATGFGKWRIVERRRLRLPVIHHPHQEILDRFALSRILRLHRNQQPGKACDADKRSSPERS